MKHDILRSAVEEACSKIAKDGIDGCEDKEVILACFGMLMFNGVEDLRKIISRSVWAIIGTFLSAVVAILLAVLLG